ncbi:heat shock protein, putative [Entamoeba invadens IP1]|uniref:Heat shock protein, putative n=1 Tax=Entamoeba invadens IP1 TaxID=370355 RepID=A0A0A1U670_ENTIV|nr:heat shock protein, putative [Entamoeba invadens IP1]ELP89847.1 heat shock protein, putative [Entamoeba invadens IP1]|eukprot:XP_004256618.1 heat shock protein, putative [Entamoeba invadens IP1]
MINDRTEKKFAASIFKFLIKVEKKFGKKLSVKIWQQNKSSCVVFTDSERLIGDAAKNQIAMNVKNTFFDAKRLIGRRFSDPTIQEDMKHWLFTVVNNGNDKPLIQVE